MFSLFQISLVNMTSEEWLHNQLFLEPKKIATLYARENLYHNQEQMIVSLQSVLNTLQLLMGDKLIQRLAYQSKSLSK